MINHQVRDLRHDLRDNMRDNSRDSMFSGGYGGRAGGVRDRLGGQDQARAQPRDPGKENQKKGETGFDEKINFEI